ncbi:MAG: ATP-binding protein [Polyangiaceae bacterium]
MVLRAVVSSLVPAAIRDDEGAARRARLLVWFAVLLESQAIFWTILYKAIGVRTVPWFLLGGGVALLAMPWILRRRPRIAGHYVVLVTFTTLALIGWFSGGLSSPALFWAVLCPIMAALVVDARACIAWSIAVALLAGVYGALDFGGVAFPPVAPGAMRLIVLLGAVTLGLVVGALAYLFESATERMNATVRLANADLRAALEKEAAGRANLADVIVALEAEQKRAAEASRAQDEFVANMNHEIRTPLNAILGLAELVSRSDELPSSLRRDVETMRSSGRVLLALVNDVLDLSRIHAGPIELEQAPVDLPALVEEIADAFRIAASQKGLKVDASVGTAVPRWALLDPTRIRQVLMNLLGNAVKFTPSGSVELRVTLDDGWLVFTVNDTGIGIATDRLRSIFDRFHQADASTTRQYGGTGLGLYISHGLVKCMGGTLQVESAIGRGSTFRARVPLLGCEDPADEAPRSLRTSPSTEGTRLRVLLVEDNSVNRVIAERMLAMLGAEVTSAADGKAGVEQAKRTRFDLILMDCQLPVMDGFDACRAIRSGGASMETRVVAFTASALAADRDRARAAGMNAFLGKPFSLADLKRVLDHAQSSGEGRPPRVGALRRRCSRSWTRRRSRRWSSSSAPSSPTRARRSSRTRGSTKSRSATRSRRRRPWSAPRTRSARARCCSGFSGSVTPRAISSSRHEPAARPMGCASARPPSSTRRSPLSSAPPGRRTRRVLLEGPRAQSARAPRIVTPLNVGPKGEFTNGDAANTGPVAPLATRKRADAAHHCTAELGIAAVVAGIPTPARVTDVSSPTRTLPSASGAKLECNGTPTLRTSAPSASYWSTL